MRTAVEPLSLDEAYLDVTVNKHGEPLAGKLARWLRATIRERIGLTASAGVGPSKLVAKIASDVNKPDGMRVVPPEEVAAFLAPLPVTRLWGVGPATARRLGELGIRTVHDVRVCVPERLAQKLGRYGVSLARLAWGDDPRMVESHRIRKSIGSETTFADDVGDPTDLCETLHGLSEEVFAELSGLGARARTATLKLRYADFTTITRSRTFEAPFGDAEALYRAGRDLLLGSTDAHALPVRLVGISASRCLGQVSPSSSRCRSENSGLTRVKPRRETRHVFRCSLSSPAAPARAQSRSRLA